MNVALVRGPELVRVVVGAAGSRPIRVHAVEAAITAGEPDGRTATRTLMTEQVDAAGDGDGSAEYKKHVAGVLLDRALQRLDRRR